MANHYRRFAIRYLLKRRKPHHAVCDHSCEPAYAGGNLPFEWSGLHEGVGALSAEAVPDVQVLAQTPETHHEHSRVATMMLAPSKNKVKLKSNALGPDKTTPAGQIDSRALGWLKFLVRSLAQRDTQFL